MSSDYSNYIRDHSSPLEPIPTGVVSEVEPLSGIRAVVFDIYGTLFISAAGDISLANDEARGDLVKQAIEEVSKIPISANATSLSEAYLRQIHAHQSRRREEGIAFPEVDIRSVWADLLEDLVLSGEWSTRRIDQSLCERIAVAYECATNPVWPMPGLPEILDHLRDRGITLGVVSNAQFYTRLLFPAFLGGLDLNALGIHPDLQVFSYEQLEGKPSVRLYEHLVSRLEPLGIPPDAVLYVGNDMRNDIRPARQAGLRTVMFAGDQRSLRWRHDDPQMAGVTPDRTITRLAEIESLI